MKKNLLMCMAIFIGMALTVTDGIKTTVYAEETVPMIEMCFTKDDEPNFNNGHYLYTVYNNSEKAMQFSTVGFTDPYVYLNLDQDTEVDTADYNYAVITFRAPKTNSYYGGNSQLYWILDSGNASEEKSTFFTPEKSYKYQSCIIDFSNYAFWKGTLTGIRIDPFVNGTSAWDTLFIHSIVFCSDKTAAEKASIIHTAAANGEINGYSEQKLSGESADSVDPFWEGRVAYNESVFPILESDGTMAPVTLAYDIDRILSVRNGLLDTEYQYGRDYDVIDGKLVIHTTGTIPCAAHDVLYAPLKPNDYWWPTLDGHYAFVADNGYYHQQQIYVTYTHSDSYTGIRPVSQLSSLPISAGKLRNGLNEKIVYIGDSITYGCSPSSFLNLKPYCPNWVNMSATALINSYPNASISYVNTAVGGTTSAWGLSEASTRIISHNPDLVVLAFGINDFTGGVSAETYAANIRQTILNVRTVLPQCEFLIVSPMLPNPDLIANASAGMSVYRSMLMTVSEQLEGVAVADVTSVHQTLLDRKSYADMTANNINHCNDYFSRIYAQVVISALTGSEDMADYSSIPLVTQTSADEVFAADQITDLAQVGGNDSTGTDLGTINETEIYAYGWFASSIPIQCFGYIYDDQIILNSEKAYTSQDVIAAGLTTAGVFGETSRFMVKVPVHTDRNEVEIIAKLKDGSTVPIWRILYTFAHDSPVTDEPDSSFSSIYLDHQLVNEQSEAEEWLKQNQLRFHTGSAKYLRMRGWISSEQIISDFGYRIDNGETIIGNYVETRADLHSDTVGYFISADVSKIQAGIHQIAMIALTESKEERIIEEFSFEVLPKAVYETVSRFNSIYLDDTLLCNVGDAAGWVRQNPVIIQSETVQSLTMRGWADNENTILAYGYTCDDGDMIIGEFIENRPELKQYIGPNAEGFLVTVPLAGMSAGTHMFKVYAMTVADEILSICSLKITVD